MCTKWWNCFKSIRLYFDMAWSNHHSFGFLLNQWPRKPSQKSWNDIKNVFFLAFHKVTQNISDFGRRNTLYSPWWCWGGERWWGRCSLQTVCGLLTGWVCPSPGPQQPWPRPKPRSWFFSVRLWPGRRAGADPGCTDKAREGSGNHRLDSILCALCSFVCIHCNNTVVADKEKQASVSLCAP